MSSELPQVSEIHLPVNSLQVSAKDQPQTTIFDIPEPLLDTFTQLDSELQGVLFHADVLVRDDGASPEDKIESKKRIELEDEFIRRTIRLGISPNPYDLQQIGEYDPNGLNIRSHREKLLQTGDTKIGQLIEVYSFDKDGRADTISRAAD